MAVSTPVKAAALVLFVAAVAGATYGVQEVLGSTIESQLFTISTPRSTLNATGGQTVTYVVNVTNRDVLPRDVVVQVEGLGNGQSALTTVRGNSTEGIFVPVDVPVEAVEGAHALTARVLSEERVLRERTGLLTLRVLPVTPGFEAGDAAEIVYVGRLTAKGTVFNMNDPELVGVAIPKTDNYRFSPGLLFVQTVPRPTIVQGVFEGMLGMQEGESRTISFGYDKGYGPATEEQFEPRQEVIVRDLTIVNDVQRVPRQTFDQYLNDTRQADPATFEEGDLFRLNQNGNMWPYRVVNLTPQVVEYRLAAEVGEAYTVYPFWANASVVQAINDTHVTFRTTPTTQPGQKFTMKASWPDMTEIVDTNDTRVVVRHSPPAGFKYTTLTPTGEPRDATIKEVTDERIVVAMPSRNPLAGMDLTFDVTIASLQKAEG